MHICLCAHASSNPPGARAPAGGSRSLRPMSLYYIIILRCYYILFDCIILYYIILCYIMIYYFKPLSYSMPYDMISYLSVR